MKLIFLVVVIMAGLRCGAQPELHSEFFSRMKAGGPLPEKLLSTRSVVAYSNTVTTKELQTIQEEFRDVGIDAVLYYDLDVLLAGGDVGRAIAFALNKRNVDNLIVISKAKGYRAFITSLNSKSTFVEENQVVWSDEDAALTELLKKVRRSAGVLSRSNLLINDFPETDVQVSAIPGRRSEFFAIDLKVDPLAVPMFGDETKDKALEALFSIYPLKYKLTKPGIPERELRAQGSLYVLCYIYTRASVARQVLGYDTSKPESAYVSVTYPNGEPMLKTYPADEYVYKFYFKHIDSGNVFLGTKWDADVTWEQALKNQIMSFKAELKLN